MARGRQPRGVGGRTWHRDSGTVGRSRRFAFTGHVSHRRVGALVGRSTGHEVVSHGSGFGDRGQSGKTPPSCSALRWLQDVGGSPLACLGVAVVMTNDHDFDRDEITQRNVKAVVKWFNETKGFGFVQLSEGAPDAFLHISVVERTGNRDVAEGATIVCDLMQGRKGLQVAEIHSVEGGRSEEHTSELRSLMSMSYDVIC